MKSPAIIVLAAAASLAAAAGALAVYANRPVRILARGLPAKVVAALESATEELASAGYRRRVILAADSANGSPAAARGASLVLFGPEAKLAAGDAAAFEALPPSLAGRVPGKIAGSTIAPGHLLPLLIDQFAASFDEARFKSAGARSPASLAELEAAMPRLAGRSLPVAVAGAEDGPLLGLVSALLVAESGLGGYRAAAAALAAGGGVGALGPALDRLAAWTRNGVLHPNWLELRDAALAVMIRDRLAAGYLGYLSERRLFDPAALEAYPFGPFPAGAAGSAAPLVSPMVSAAVPAGAGRAGFELLGRLSASEVLGRMASRSGLTPAASAAPAADLQARLARQAAAESGTVAGLGADGASPGRGPADLASEIREAIRSRR